MEKLLSRAPTLSKITPPRANNSVERPRLFQRLDQLNDINIIWLAGPPGSGKTILANSYLSRHNHIPLWYQMDANDADIATFFHYFRLAVEQAMPQCYKKLPVLTPEYLPGLTAFIRRYAEIIGAHINKSAVIVFDNYEQLPTETPLHDVIRELVSYSPPEISFLILSRTKPPQAFARLRLHEQLAVLEAAELDLTLDEARAIAMSRELQTGLRLDFERIEQMFIRTRGWIAGFTLFLTNPRGMAGNYPDWDGTQQVIFDYFTAEIFIHFPLSIQKGLLYTALLPVMTRDNVEKLTGDPEIVTVLADLQHRNFFVIQSGQAEVVYEYHGLFRAFLLNRAVAIFSSDEWRNLKIKAAGLLACAGYVDAASNLYCEAKDWSGLAKLALDEGSALISAGRHQTLEQWLKCLPIYFFQQYPWLYYWLGMAQLPFDPIEARCHLEKAYAGFSSDDDPDGLYLAWSAIMDTFFYEWQDLRSADYWIAEFEALQARHPNFPSRIIEMRTYWAMGALLHRQPEHPFLPLWAERARSILNSDDRELSVLLGGYLIVWYLWKGNSSDAQELIQRLNPWTCTPELSPLVSILWSCAVGLYHSARGDLEACLQVVQNGLSLAAKTGLHCWDFMLSAQAVRASLVAGNLASAETWISAMAASIRNHSHTNGAFLAHLQSNVAAQHRDWFRAEEHARKGLAMALESGVPFLEGHCRIDLARALIGQNNCIDWREQLRITDTIAQSMNSKVLQYLCLETKAHEAFARGKEQEGREWLEQALALSRIMGGAIWQMAGPQAAAQLYNQALLAGIEVDHVQEIIRCRGLIPSDPSKTSDLWPWPVRIYTLGRFEILCDNEPLRSSRKAQHKPLELIKILCAFGGRAIHQERVTDALWPDAAGDAAEQALGTTLHRLRKLLQHEQAVRLENRQLSLDLRYIWVDALAFDSIAHHPNCVDQASLQCALARYRGHFLDGESSSWALACRERLRSHFLKMSERLGSILEQQDDWLAAIDCYHRVIEIEPVAERFYRRLMTCHVQLGQRAEALTVFQRCRQALLAHLGVSPTRETQALYQRLMDQ